MRADIGARTSEAVPFGVRPVVFLPLRLSVLGLGFAGFNRVTGK
jgi:hypothetical protein